MDKKLKKAKKAINSEKIIIYPTETAYGIGADATSFKAVEKVYKAKKRPKEKGLTVIVNSKNQAKKYGVIDTKEEKLIDKFMPGPLTLVVDKKDKLPSNLNDDFVFRISSNRTARKLAERNPITATSANISGNETSYSISNIDKDLKQNVEEIINQGDLDPSPTSTIVEIINEEPTIHREGPVKKEEIQKVIN